jgi:hypothetical protein
MASPDPTRARFRRLALAAVRVGAASVLTVASVAGCGNGQIPQAVIPNGGHDTAQLAKCTVSASHDQPLVTEWPASYKARLEAMLQNGAVAVEYSGCELRIVDRCKIGGTYAWHRTTLSTDTTDIRDEDELFAKLPLGAATLEGELKTSGSLHVQTTVAGQMQLVGKAADDATSGAECARATHLVTALSVGAFKLVAGGGVAAKAGADVGLATAKVGTNQTKSILRAAGDPTTCDKATKVEPHVDCRSPIQIFLTPIHRSVPLNILSPLPDEKG